MTTTARDIWWRRAAEVQRTIDAWSAADDPAEVDLAGALATAAEIYGLSEHDADMCLELIQPPMRAPSYHAAALAVIVASAVAEAGAGWADGRLDVRNLVWLQDECWCWGGATINPACPRHARRAAPPAHDDLQVRRG